MGERTNRRRNDGWMDGYMDEWVSEWVSETNRQGIREKEEKERKKRRRQTNQRRNERTHIRTGGRTEGWMNEWVSEWMSEWVNERMNEWMNEEEKKIRTTDRQITEIGSLVYRQVASYADVLRTWRSSLERLRWRLISISDHRELSNSWSELFGASWCHARHVIAYIYITLRPLLSWFTQVTGRNA